MPKFPNALTINRLNLGGGVLVLSLLDFPPNRSLADCVIKIKTFSVALQKKRLKTYFIDIKREIY